MRLVDSDEGVLISVRNTDSIFKAWDGDVIGVE
jgi:hypothetical protein